MVQFTLKFIHFSFFYPLTLQERVNGRKNGHRDQITPQVDTILIQDGTKGYLNHYCSEVVKFCYC